MSFHFCWYVEHHITLHGLRVLASEVTPGLLAGAEPDTHQFNVTIFL